MSRSSRQTCAGQVDCPAELNLKSVAVQGKHKLETDMDNGRRAWATRADEPWPQRALAPTSLVPNEPGANRKPPVALARARDEGSSSLKVGSRYHNRLRTLMTGSSRFAIAQCH